MCPQAGRNQGQASRRNDQNKGKKQTVQLRQGRLNFTNLADLPEGAQIMSGTFSINHHPAIILFDSGASHSFISSKFGARVGLAAVIHALKIWRHYLMGTHCNIFTDYKSLKYIFTQSELNMRQ